MSTDPTDPGQMTEKQAVAVLHELQDSHPRMEVWMGTVPPASRVWFARGRDGEPPWLLMSSDLQKFWTWLDT